MSVGRILICGSNGQLGQELQKVLARGTADIGPIDGSWADVEVVATDYDELDITDAGAVEEALAGGDFDAVINCAAATNVDGCEADPAFAQRLNADAPANLAASCARHGAVLVQVSTDYVLSGTDPMPQAEDAPCAPDTVYGTTKLEGENAVRRLCPRHFIVRTAWLYGSVGKNFVRTMVGLGRTHDAITVVDDQHGSPTNANDLAYEILALLMTENYGTYHATGNGATTWNRFAESIMELAGLPCEVRGCTTEEYGAPAPRPAWSILDNKHLRDTIGDSMRSWDVALEGFMTSHAADL